MTFQLLAQHLHETAELAKDYFQKQHGAKHFEVEVQVDKDLSLRPTFRAQLSDGYILCVEVSEKPYSNSLDTFVLDCSVKNFPVKLYVVTPSTKGDGEFSTGLKRAKERGVGVIEIDNTASVLADAVSLSLFGLRRTKVQEFPVAKRETVRIAEHTFLNGNPVKGCQSLYEELEALTRAFAERTKSEGWWRALRPPEKYRAKNLKTDSWAFVLEDLQMFLEIPKVKAKCSSFSGGIISTARASTESRNATSHKPNTLKKLIERDEKLRTSFESCRDSLKIWFDATKPLKLKY